MVSSVVTVPIKKRDPGTRGHWPKTRGVRKVSAREAISFAMAVIWCVMRVIESCEGFTIVWRRESRVVWAKLIIMLNVEDTSS